MAIISRESFPVKNIQVKELVSESLLDDATVRMDYEPMMRSIIITMEKRMLAGSQHEVVAEASVKAETVNSVWDAVCVYWLAPLFALLYDRTRIEKFLQLEVWSGLHVEFVEEHDRNERRVYTRFCPHIAVPDNQHHIEFLQSHGEIDFYGPQDS